jgi:archaellum component FlaF (FlaF/FlaG flagellin family)
MLLAIIAQIHSKFKLNQFIDVKSAMAAYVVCIALICLTKVVMVYLIFNELYPEMQDVAAQAYAERRAELKAQGVEIGEMQADFSLKASLVNIAIEFLGYLIPGFIIALVIKKKPAAA